MKEYINQIFYEGLGKSLYCPIENKINNIKNNKISNNLTLLCKVIYFIFSILLSFMLLYVKL